MQLRLTLYAKYFYAIYFGQKKIEYRKLSKYYENKFKKEYDSILFINGYGNKRPWMIVELKEVVKTDKCYELHLGELVTSGNINFDNELFNAS